MEEDLERNPIIVTTFSEYGQSQFEERNVNNQEDEDSDSSSFGSDEDEMASSEDSDDGLSYLSKFTA
jgi:hypothetical protein